jgi:hypothetical protein
MTKKYNTTRSTLIAQLAKQRTKILGVAQKDGERTLVREELARLDALGSVIANTPPETSADRAILADIAYERIERLIAGCAKEQDVEIAFAALRSVWLTRPENKHLA